jgi:DNA-binding FadR family transcriptional regulator
MRARGGFVPLQAIESQRLYQQVAQQIREMILSGEYGAGDRLPAERDLARGLKVSRPTVREAMIALEIAGLVEIRTGAGIFVSDQPVRSAEPASRAFDVGSSPFELLAARRFVECELAAQAATRASEDDLAGIEESVRTMASDIEAGRPAQQADRNFHSRIAAVSRNSVLVSIVHSLWDGTFEPLFAALSARTGLPGNQRMTLADHRAVLAALKRRDAKAARRAMATHLGHVEKILAGAADLARGDADGRPPRQRTANQKTIKQTTGGSR